MKDDRIDAAQVESMPELDLSDLSTYEIEPPDFLVEELLETGDIVNLAARWGLGKTWFAQALSLGIADESVEEFLGRRLMKHGPVCYFDSESKERSVKNRLKWLGGDSESARDIHYYLSAGRVLTDAADLAQIHETIQRHSPALVVFDSLTRLRHGRDENSADQMAQFFAESIQPISREFGSAVLLLDHVTKAGRSSEPDLVARGSGDKAAQTDRIWALKKHSRSSDALVLEFGRAKDGPSQDGVVFQRHHEPARVWFEVMSGEQADDLEVDPYGVLPFLEERGDEVPQKELVRQLFDGRDSAASKALKGLGGRVSTRKDPGDRRQNIVILVEPESEAVNRRLVAAG